MRHLYLCLLAALPVANGSLLLRDPTDPCVAYGNATTFNISSLGRVKASGDKYEYTFDCAGMTTDGCYNGGDGKHSGHPAVCQLDTTSGGVLNYNAGEVEAALWLAPFNFYGTNNFTVMYPNIQQCGKEARSCGTDGYGIRVSMITFIVDDSLASPTFKFINEEPYTQYNFEVRGGDFVSRL